MNSSPAHTQPAVPAADSVSGTPDAPARTGYVPGPDTLRAETAFAGTNFANPAFAETAFAETAFADGGSAPFSVAATGAAPSEWRDTTSAAIFGAQSTLAEPARIPLAPPPPLAENALFQSFVLLLAATYAMLLYRNLGDVRTLLGRISRDAATGKRFSEDPGGSGYSRFLNIATAIGLLFLGVEVYRQKITIICQAFDKRGISILDVSEFRFLWKPGLADTTIRQNERSNPFFQFQYMGSDGGILQYSYDISCFYGFTVFSIYLLNFSTSSCHDPYGWMLCSNGDFCTYDIRIFEEAAPDEEQCQHSEEYCYSPSD